jgi:hypothetical protein
MGFAFAGQRVDAPGGAVFRDLPSRLDVGIAFQPAKRPVKRSAFDLRVGKSVGPQTCRQIVPVGGPFFSKDEQDHRLNEAGKVSHRTRAWIGMARTAVTIVTYQFPLHRGPRFALALPGGIDTLLLDGLSAAFKKPKAETNIRRLPGAAPAQTPVPSLVLDSQFHCGKLTKNGAPYSVIKVAITPIE